MTRIVPLTCVFVSALLALTALAPAQSAAPPVSREEYDRLLQQQEQMRQELERLKAERPAPARTPATQPAAEGPDNQLMRQKDFDGLDDRLHKLEGDVHSGLPGTEHFLLLGDAAVGFVSPRHSDSTFTAAVAPLFLWEPTDRVLFEAAFDAGVSTDSTGASSTSIDLTIADASFIVNDHLIVGGGLFVVPFGQYHNHFDPPWINKLPDDPLVFSDGGLAPSSEVGIFARGAYPVRGIPGLGLAKVTYDAYLTNGPLLITGDPAAAGSLNFNDFTDLNNGKAAGGRIGFLPVPGMELGYSIQYSQAAPSGFQHAYVLLQAADFNWVQEVRPLGGTITARAEWVWSEVENVTYDPHGKLGFGPLSFGNWRQGGYAMIAYRPTLATDRHLRNTEFVFRYDTQRTPLGAPGGAHEQRYAFGVDYWVTPSVVLKVAYEIDDRKPGPGADAFFIQLGLGL
jgi:hypothetical protein